MPSHAFLEHTGVLAFAHRGDSEAAPENTAAAFESAVAQGFQYLETDVHRTRDGVLLAFHDDRLDRVTSDRGRIAALDYSVIARARVHGREPIPLLEELLAAFPLTRFNIDPKSDEAIEPLIEVIRKTSAQERVCIGSFSDKRLRHIRAALPGVCTSMATFETTRARLASIGVPTGVLQAACAQVPVWWNGSGGTQLAVLPTAELVHGREPAPGQSPNNPARRCARGLMLPGRADHHERPAVRRHAYGGHQSPDTESPEQRRSRKRPLCSLGRPRCHHDGRRRGHRCVQEKHDWALAITPGGKFRTDPLF